MALSEELVESLICPESGARLLYFRKQPDPAEPSQSEFLFCPESRLKYRIEDGIAVLLVEEAERVDPAEAERLVAQAAGSAAP